MKACLALALSFSLLASAAHAERADRRKPLNITANQQTGNLDSGESVFEGNFVAAQGSMLMRADRATIRRDKEGYLTAWATGKPVTYREKRERVEDFINAQAERVDYDERAGTVKLTGKARITSQEGEIIGEVITYNLNSGAYQVAAGGSVATDQGPRVRAVILPKAKPDGDEAPGISLKAQSVIPAK
jgi:lipopolysaccharide export system protein LptA